MRVSFIFLSLFIFLSCGDGDQSTSKNPKSDLSSVEVPMPLFSEEVVFNDAFITEKSFSNGDPILQAQSKVSWVKAAREEKPAWCYADSIKKQGVLYNGYCLQDERKLISNDRFMNEIEGALFSSGFDASSVVESDLYLTERNYLGGFYNLGFHNIWLEQSGTDLGKNYVLSYNPTRALVQLRKSHPGNGYYIRTLKD